MDRDADDVALEIWIAAPPEAVFQEPGPDSLATPQVSRG